jgi:hypothetical protein
MEDHVCAHGPSNLRVVKGSRCLQSAKVISQKYNIFQGRRQYLGLFIIKLRNIKFEENGRRMRTIIQLELQKRKRMALL